jgi:hypothetical protein
MCAPLLHPENGKVSRIALLIKFVCFLASLFEVILLIYNCGSLKRLAIDFEFFTTWGVIMTFVCMSCSLYVQLANKPKKQHSLCAWKVYIFLFEQALVYEVIITGLFWTVLFDSMINRPIFQDPWQKLGLKMHHSLPMLLLTADYTISVVPYVKRHITLVMPVFGCYVVVNLGFTISRGKPVYDIVDWNSIRSYFIIVGAWSLGFFLFILFHWINQKKLNFYGQYR